jgi:hypothetical protein
VPSQAEVSVMSREFCAQAGWTTAYETMTATNKKRIRINIELGAPE